MNNLSVLAYLKVTFYLCKKKNYEKIICNCLVLGGIVSYAQNTINNTKMEKKEIIRLVYPQWQGGDIAKLVPEISNSEDASRGYFLGANLLNFLAPDNGQESLIVPISTEVTERKIINGVLDRDVIVQQTSTALKMLEQRNPNKIVTLGGECSVSVVPFTYLANKYNNDVANDLD